MNAVPSDYVEMFWASEEMLNEWALEAGYTGPTAMCKHYTGQSVEWLLSQIDVIPDCDIEAADSLVMSQRQPITMHTFTDVGGRLYVIEVDVYRSVVGGMYINAEALA